MTNNAYKFHPYDIDECIQAVLISFDIQFEKDELGYDSTLGDLYSLVEKKLAARKIDDTSTTQQAFYKLRHSIAQVLEIDEKAITPSASLEKLFPRTSRRKKIALVEEDAGIKKKFLKMNSWVSGTLALGIVASLVLAFLFWEEALLATALLILANWILARFNNELRYSSLGEAVAALAVFEYTAFRRDPDTFNLHEIKKSINEIFMRKAMLEPERLQPDFKLFR